MYETMSRFYCLIDTDVLLYSVLLIVTHVSEDEKLPKFDTLGKKREMSEQRRKNLVIYKKRKEMFKRLRKLRASILVHMYSIRIFCSCPNNGI